MVDLTQPEPKNWSEMLALPIHGPYVQSEFHCGALSPHRLTEVTWPEGSTARSHSSLGQHVDKDVPTRLRWRRKGPTSSPSTSVGRSIRTRTRWQHPTILRRQSGR